MTQKRGLGRGLGALIPGAGSAPAPTPTPELRTRTPRTDSPSERTAAERPVDMFFSGERVDGEATSARTRGNTRDLAGARAQAAARRRGRGPAGKASTARTASGKGSSATSGTEADETTTAARKTSTAKAPAKKAPAAKTSASRSTASKSSTAKAPASKGAAAKAPASKGTASKSTAAKSSGSKAPTSKASPPAATTSSALTTSKSSSATTAPAKSSASTGSTPATKTSSSTASPAKSSTPKSSTPKAAASSAAEPDVPTTALVEDETTATAEASPVVDVERVELTPAQRRAAAAEAPAEDEAPAPTEAEPAADETEPVDADAEATAAEAEATTAEAESAAEDESETASDEDASVSAEGEYEAADTAPEDEDDASGDDETGPTGFRSVSPSDGLVAVPGAEFAEIPIHEIRENPRNPRTLFDDDELDELAFSLRQVGVLQPVVVRPIPVTEDGESFELVMGERRWRAARRAGLTSIPAIIRETSDDDLLRDALLENLHRSQLNPLEEAAAYQQLLEDFGCTQDELGERIGRSRPQITNTLRLLRLPALVQRRLASGALSAGHARALLSLDDPSLMEELAQRIVSEGLSVRAVERLVARGGAGTQGATRTVRRSTYDPHVVDLTSRLSNRLETQVRIDVGKRKGKITLEFTNLEDLERLVETMGLDASFSSDED